MNLQPYFRSVLEEDHSAVVLCNPEHEILYMNPAAVERYAGWGGAGLVGKSLLDCHNPKSRERIGQVLDWFRESRDHNRVYTFRNDRENKDVYMIALRDETGALIGYYEKHEYRDAETMARYDFW